jgi:glutamine amidotransferase
MSRAAKVALVDYGAGNIRSVAKALERSGLDVEVTNLPAVVLAADGVVLPGAGAFADAMATLRATGLEEAVKQTIDAGRPYLGLCVGVQVLFEEGEEHGRTPGMGVFGGRVERFPAKQPDGSLLRVPQIGWNEVRFRGDHPMIDHLPARDHYYFVHSYRPMPTDSSIVAGVCDYGGNFAAAVANPSIFAVQFHPEKSQQAGKRVLDAYRHWVEEKR